MLSSILVVVATSTLLETRRFARWDRPVSATVHPIAMEPGAAEYVRALQGAQLAPVGAFLDAEARRYGVQLAPGAVTVRLGASLEDPPPERPETEDVASAIAWSLSFRWWIVKARWSHELGDADLRIFALYYEPHDGRVLPHSTGLERARAGVAHLFAAQATEGSNRVIIAHELLHTIGAEDQYDASGRPTVLGDPQQKPLYPQRRAALMAGRLAISASEARIPEDLSSCVVSPETAREIGWAESPR